MVNGRVKTGDFLIHGTSKEMTGSFFSGLSEN